eukprot:CAMPEP_0113962028 /NCGR_PEP_ID=MMETSP0011_2-20120614/5668_1 /TAXON_ID=101924 /ORGANISM="Rhodosorus marinus" /LENGTH=239 /DNA_ID=CAMNT_0000973797 /DNA_START=45 /DNA_END=764 /DNA_ORIENTATION=+ /assembly_acc=CAM_ASM_000156
MAVTARVGFVQPTTNLIGNRFGRYASTGRFRGGSKVSINRRLRMTTELSPLDSGYISTLPKSQQAAITLGISVGIALGTVALIDLVVPVLRHAPYALPASRLLGFVYAFAGFGHFQYLDGFCKVMPEKGEWGWWYLPGSAQFHVIWTGVAEIAGGLAVLGGDLPFIPQWVGPWGAAGLFLLTICVTPANLRSITHGESGPVKEMTGQEVTIPAAAHVFRALLQCGLLAILYSMATGYHS